MIGILTARIATLTLNIYKKTELLAANHDKILGSKLVRAVAASDPRKVGRSRQRHSPAESGRDGHEFGPADFSKGLSDGCQQEAGIQARGSGCRHCMISV